MQKIKNLNIGLLSHIESINNGAAFNSMLKEIIFNLKLYSQPTCHIGGQIRDISDM